MISFKSFLHTFFLLIFTLTQTAQAGFWRYEEDETFQKTKAITTSLSNGMNFHKTLETMASSETVKAVAFSVLSAAAMYNLIGPVTAPGAEKVAEKSLEQSFTDCLKFSFTKAGVDATLKVMIYGENVGSAIKEGLISGAIDTVGSFAAGQIGKMYDPTGVKDKGLNFVTHKAAHACVGGVMGALISDDAKRGAISGAIGAVAAEIVAETCFKTSAELKQQILKDAEAKGQPLDPKSREFNEQYQTRLRTQADWSKMAGGVVTLLAGQDVKVSLEAAENAVRNNYMEQMKAALEESQESTSEKDGYDTDDEAQETSYGKFREDAAQKLYLKEAGQKISDNTQSLQKYFEMLSKGQDAYCQERGRQLEASLGRSLSSQEREILYQCWSEHYAEDSTALSITTGALNLPGAIIGTATAAVDNSLRYSGLTEKGTARAVRWAIDDALLVGTLGYTGGAIVNKVAQLTTKGLGKIGLGSKATAKQVKGNLPEVDYTTPEAPYSLRIDPITNRGPMSIDARDFTSATSYTVEGAARNKNQFWKLWSEKYPETLSEKNLLNRHKKSPIVDEQWIKYFPEHQNYLGDTLIHHHIEHGYLTTALPKTLHEQQPGRALFHSNLGGKRK